MVRSPRTGAERRAVPPFFEVAAGGRAVRCPIERQVRRELAPLSAPSPWRATSAASGMAMRPAIGR
jgi:hypothetical protein